MKRCLFVFLFFLPLFAGAQPTTNPPYSFREDQFHKIYIDNDARTLYKTIDYDWMADVESGDITTDTVKQRIRNATTTAYILIPTTTPLPITIYPGLYVDNLYLDGNTLGVKPSDVNGGIVLNPNGTGVIELDADTIVDGRLYADLWSLSDNSMVGFQDSGSDPIIDIWTTGTLSSTIRMTVGGGLAGTNKFLMKGGLFKLYTGAEPTPSYAAYEGDFFAEGNFEINGATYLLGDVQMDNLTEDCLLRLNGSKVITSIANGTTSQTLVMADDGTQVWRDPGTGGTGSVTSVALSLPTSVFDISGSPVTTAGTLTATFDTQTANKVFASAVSGGAATPGFRAVVAADLPDAAADGATKGAAGFNAADFSAAGGIINIDYTNGQAASTFNNGFLSAVDWADFDGKQDHDTDLDYLATVALSANVKTILNAADYAAVKTALTLNLVENTALSTWAGTTNITTLGTIATGIWGGTVIAAGVGGTGQTSYAIGDMIYASGATTLSKLADVAAGAYLRSGGVTTAPLWSTLILPNAATTSRLAYATATNTIGESSQLAFATGTGLVTQATSANFSFWVDNYVTGVGGASIRLAKSKNATPGSHTIVANGDTLGALWFYGSDGSAFTLGGNIQAKVDGTPGASPDMPTRIELAVSPDGSATPAIGFTLKNDKQIILGSTAPAADRDTYAEAHFVDGATGTMIRGDGGVNVMGGSLYLQDTIRISNAGAGTFLSSAAGFFYSTSVESIAAGAGAGTAPTVSITGNGQAGYIDVTAGTTPSILAVVVTVTPGFTAPTAMHPVISPANLATGLLTGASDVNAQGASTTTWTMTSQTTALIATTVYRWNYTCGAN